MLKMIEAEIRKFIRGKPCRLVASTPKLVLYGLYTSSWVDMRRLLGLSGLINFRSKRIATIAVCIPWYTHGIGETN